MTAVADGITQLRLPMTGSPLSHINAYLIEDEDGCTLVDCGWKTDDVLEALVAGLRDAGKTLGDVRRLLITHAHFDHYGLAATLRRAGVPALGLHEREWTFAQEHLIDPVASDATADAWIARNGYEVEPDPDGESFYHARTELAPPTFTIADGERIGRLRAIATPGHTPGHLCFIDERSGRILTGDHVLDPITPHVGLWREARGNPLGEYVASLERLLRERTTGVLPAHGEPFPDLERRLRELLAHERAREAQVVSALHDGAETAADVARSIPWTRKNRAFDELAGYHQQFAVAETLAHLEHLASRGMVRRKTEDDPIPYRMVER